MRGGPGGAETTRRSPKPEAVENMGASVLTLRQLISFHLNTLASDFSNSDYQFLHKTSRSDELSAGVKLNIPTVNTQQIYMIVNI